MLSGGPISVEVEEWQLRVAPFLIPCVDSGMAPRGVRRQQNTDDYSEEEDVSLAKKKRREMKEEAEEQSASGGWCVGIEMMSRREGFGECD